MKPDIRPIEILTRAILDTSPAWMILDGVGRGYHLRTALIRIHPNDITFRLNSSDGTWFDKSDTCYPCKADAPFEPIPWPVVEGEEIIDALYNVPANHTVYLPDNYDRYICKTPSGLALVSMPMRPGYHPSPRRFIDTDGSCVPVWVWEKDA